MWMNNECKIFRKPSYCFVNHLKPRCWDFRLSNPVISLPRSGDRYAQYRGATPLYAWRSHMLEMAHCLNHPPPSRIKDPVRLSLLIHHHCRWWLARPVPCKKNLSPRSITVRQFRRRQRLKRSGKKTPLKLKTDNWSWARSPGIGVMCCWGQVVVKERVKKSNCRHGSSLRKRRSRTFKAKFQSPAGSWCLENNDRQWTAAINWGRRNS